MKQSDNLKLLARRHGGKVASILLALLVFSGCIDINLRSKLDPLEYFYKSPSSYAVDLKARTSTSLPLKTSMQIEPKNCKAYKRIVLLSSSATPIFNSKYIYARNDEATIQRLTNKRWLMPPSQMLEASLRYKLNSRCINLVQLPVTSSGALGLKVRITSMYLNEKSANISLAYEVLDAKQRLIEAKYITIKNKFNKITTINDKIEILQDALNLALDRLATRLAYIGR